MMSRDYHNIDPTELVNTNNIVFESKTKKSSDKKSSGYDQDYNTDTTEVYRAHRITKCDPLTNQPVDMSYAFKFKEMWDAYSGERKEDDPYGPLIFHPFTLVYYFYKNRLKNLWIESQWADSEGMFGDAVGNGPDFKTTRGEHPEWDLFRLPIANCYLTDNHNMMVPTLGPRLTSEELNELKRLSVKAIEAGETFEKLYNITTPPMNALVKLYNTATDRTPVDLDDEQKQFMSTDEIKTVQYKANCEAVQKLRNL